MDRETSYLRQMSRMSSQCSYAKFSVWFSRHSCASKTKAQQASTTSHQMSGKFSHRVRGLLPPCTSLVYICTGARAVPGS